MSAVYRHPDGSTLAYSDSELTATDQDGNSVSLPIGPTGMLELAGELVALANERGNLSEQAGAGAALDCLDALLAAKKGTQGERITIVRDAIVSLSATANPARAAGGFAVALENVVTRAMRAQP
jgi:hypothetical protein